MQLTPNFHYFTRFSPLSGRRRTKIICCRSSDLEAWKNGKPIQEAMPYLSADDREFILTGITAEEWDQAFGADEDA